MHDRLDDRRADRLSRVVRELGEPVLLDSGDALRAGNVYYHPGGEPILERMSRLSYAAMAMGNREFHVWPSWMRRKLHQASFPVLAANVEARGDVSAPFRPSTVMRTGDLNVGIFGIVHPMVSPDTWVAQISGFRFTDPIETAKAVARELAAKADVIVALAHCPVELARRVAAIPEVHLTLAGHGHRVDADLRPDAILIESGYHAQVASVVWYDAASRCARVEVRNLASNEESRS